MERQGLYIRDIEPLAPFDGVANAVSQPIRAFGSTTQEKSGAVLPPWSTAAGLQTLPRDVRKLDIRLSSSAQRSTDAPANETTDPFDVGQAVKSLLPMLALLAGARIAVSGLLPQSPCLVMADAQQFEIAVINLALNAREAMMMGGALVVEVRPVIGAVEICVSDTGCGIGPDAQRQIFDPRVAGNGLAQVSQFVAAAGGRVKVQSAIGEGASFTLRLPQFRGPAASTPVRVEHERESRTAPEAPWALRA